MRLQRAGDPRPAAAGPRRTPRSLRTKLAVSFAAVAAGVTALVGFLSYDSAARLVRVDQQAVFGEVVHDLRTPGHASRCCPRTTSPRATPTDDGCDGLTPPGRHRRAGGPGGPDRRQRQPAPGVDAAAVGTAGAQAAERPRRVTTTWRSTATSTGWPPCRSGDGRGAVQVAQEFQRHRGPAAELQQRTLLFAGAVVAAAGLFGWWLARRIAARPARRDRGGRRLDRPARRRGAGGGRRRGRQPGPVLRPDAGPPRPLDGGPAPARPGRGPRTPHAADLAAHEHLPAAPDRGLPPAAREELVADRRRVPRDSPTPGQRAGAPGGGPGERRRRSSRSSSPRPPRTSPRRPGAARATHRHRPHRGRHDDRGPPRAATSAPCPTLVENAAKFDVDGRHPIEIAVRG